MTPDGHFIRFVCLLACIANAVTLCRLVYVLWSIEPFTTFISACALLLVSIMQFHLALWPKGDAA